LLPPQARQKKKKINQGGRDIQQPVTTELSLSQEEKEVSRCATFKSDA